MEKDKGQMTDRILNITLEIIYLLTGEDYVPSQKTSDDTTSSSSLSRVSEGSSRSPIADHTPQNDQKILQLTNEIIKLMSGEVPVRSEDVAIYLSMEEWEYYEGHQDLYTEGVKKGHQPQSLDDDIKSESFPVEIVALPIPQTGVLATYNPSEGPVRSVSNESDDSSLSADEDPHSAELYNNPHPTPAPENLQMPLKFYKCAECSMFLPSTSDMLRHRKLHKKKKLSCSQCGKIFPHKMDLIRHQCVHTEKKGDHVCAQCGESFLFRLHLFTHLRVHTGEKALICQDCGKHFCSNYALITHRRMHTGEKPYKCNECGKEYTQKQSLVIHQKFHIEGKPFSCHECGERCLRQSHLDNHRKTPKVMRRYNCPDCGDFFMQLCNLVNHQKIHSAEKSFSS